MTLGDRFLVDANLPRNIFALRAATTQHRSFHQVPGFVPSDAQNLRGPLDVCRQKHINGQRLKQVREPAARLRPR